MTPRDSHADADRLHVGRIASEGPHESCLPRGLHRAGVVVRANEADGIARIDTIEHRDARERRAGPSASTTATDRDTLRRRAVEGLAEGEERRRTIPWEAEVGPPDVDVRPSGALAVAASREDEFEFGQRPDLRGPVVSRPTHHDPSGRQHEATGNGERPGVERRHLRMVAPPAERDGRTIRRMDDAAAPSGTSSDEAPPLVRSAPASAALDRAGLEYRITSHGRVASLEEAAAARGVRPGDIVKTLVVRRGADDFLFVLVPGDREISWPKLRAALGVTRMSMPDARTAREVTGYERGTITPFGATHPWPVIADPTVLGRVVSIGAGAHGVAATLDGTAAVEALGALVADVTEPLQRH